MRATARVALEKKWQELIRQQQQSKLSVSAFCRRHGFSDQSFYNWRKRLLRASPFDSRWWRKIHREPTGMRRWN